MPAVPARDDPDLDGAPVDGLNPDQLDAVVHRGGPLLVVAGAGSGKTRVLTHRIAHLIHEGVHPARILAITFTNKAADEMRQRVAELVGPVARTMWVSTFHSACVRMLRANADRLGYPRQFSIYDQADAVRLTGYVIRDLGPRRQAVHAPGVHGVISLWKNELVDPDEAAAGAQHIFERKQAEVYREYQARLLKAGAMDFDDLLVNTVRLLREHPDVLEGYRQRFEHILVDEYQDTNQAQNEIVLLLAGGHQNVSRRRRHGPVGVPLSGRRLPQHHAVRGRVPGGHHGRARPELPQHADHPRRRQRGHRQQRRAQAEEPVDRRRPGRPHRALPRRGRGRRGHLRRLDAPAAPRGRRLNWRDVAVLYRTNAQSRVVEEAMMRLGVPYKVVGGTRFYDRREIKDAMAYLRGVVNPADEVSVKRVLNVPKRGVGDASVAKLDAFAAATGVGFLEALRRADDAGVTGPAARGIDSFVALLDGSRDGRAGRGTTGEDDGDGAGPGDLLQAALEESGYLAELEAEDTVESAGRLENLAELVGSAREFTRSTSSSSRSRSSPTPTTSRRRGRRPGRADDAALGQGARVPRRVPHRRRGGRVPAHAGRSPSPTSWRRSGASPTSGSPGPGAAVRHPRLEPQPVRLDAVQPAVAVPRRDPRRARRGAGQRHRPQRLRPPEPAARDRTGVSPPAYRRAAAPRDRDDERRADAHRERVVEAAIAAGQRTRAGADDAHDLGLRIGDDVEHPAFGEGVVIDLRGHGEAAEATVNFAGVGTKHLALALAPLRKR